MIIDAGLQRPYTVHNYIVPSAGLFFHTLKEVFFMRLPNSYGSVYKLKGNRRHPWCVRKTIGWKDNGQPLYMFIGYYASRQEALTALSDYNKDPYDLQLASITFDQLYDRWSEEHFRKISQSGITSYRSVYSCCGDIGRMKICDIKLDHLQRIMDGSGKNSPTLKTMKNLFGLMWDYAVIHEIITPDRREMIRYLDISKPGNPNKMNRQPFTRKELDRLWEMKDANTYISVVLIMIYTGVRIGELLDLMKEDVHLEERWMYIKEAKTAAGIREVPIAEKIVPLIEQWISRSCDHLICSGSDAALSYYVFRENYWNPVMDLLSMDHRPHDTRHTCVSMLTEAGVDERIIRKIVGHKGQGVTETVYTHMELPVKLEAINKI